ncbi:S41 family peptidase [Mogibacterium pumilum]|nr:S41 family peptidase [Mogibacterium pumilum]
MFKSESSMLKRHRTSILAFAAGFGSAVICAVVIMHVVLDGRLISRYRLDQYEAINDEFGKYYEMQKIISNKSYYKQDDDDIDKAIASGILKTVDDKYAEYMTEKEYEAFERRYLTSYSGVGVALKLDENDKIVVNRVLSGSDAERLGITAGDVLLKIDGKNVKSLDDAAKLMNDHEENDVEFTISRGGVIKKYKLTRSKVEDDGVAYEVKDSSKNIGYIRINTFRKGTAKSFKNAVEALKVKDCNKIIIDVRGNTGGVVEEAFGSADKVLKKAKLGKIVSKNKTKTYTSDEKSADVKLIVLVDQDTASAAEIFAAVLKTNGVKIIGAKTYGKGVIQTVFKIKDGSVVKLTTAEYIDPNGKKINEKGVMPNVEAASGEAAMKEAMKLFESK